MKKNQETNKRPEPGRPPKDLTEEQWKQVNYSLEAGCNGASIARQFGIHPSTFYTKIMERYGEEYNISNFSAYAALKIEEGNDRLRRKQMDTAMGNGPGSTTMQIWLGKQKLGQKDQIEQSIIVPQVNVHALSEQEQLEVSTALIAIEQHENNDSIHEELNGSSEQ